MIKNPYSPMYQRYRRTGFSFYQGNKVRDSLIKKGIIRLVRIKRPDGMVKLIEPTSKGKQILKRLGYDIDKGWRKGSLDHQYWVREVAEQDRKRFKNKGLRVFEEYAIGEGKSVDVAIIDIDKGKRLIAREIETGKSDCVWNIRKDLDAGFSEVTSIALDRKAEEKIKRQIKEAGLDGEKRIKVLGIKELLV
jgi:DNA-directed RNA polymerase subunit K/omega